MKRRNFLGFAGLAAVPAIPTVFNSRQTQEPQARILVRPSIEGRELPPVKPDRRTRIATLCPANAQKIAAKIEEMFRGKVLIVAKSRADNLEIEIDVEMVADWVDYSSDLVKVSLKDDYTSLYFSCGGYFYTFDSRAKAPHARNDYKDAYFYIERDKLTVKQRAPGGLLNVYVFTIQPESAST